MGQLMNISFESSSTDYHFLLTAWTNWSKFLSNVDQLMNTSLIKKKIKFFHIYNEIQSGAVAKSYMRKGFLIYEEMRKYFPIYEEAVSHSHSEFRYIWEKFDFLFYQCSFQRAPTDDHFFTAWTNWSKFISNVDQLINICFQRALTDDQLTIIIFRIGSIANNCSEVDQLMDHFLLIWINW